MKSGGNIDMLWVISTWWVSMTPYLISDIEAYVFTESPPFSTYVARKWYQRITAGPQGMSIIMGIGF